MKKVRDRNAERSLCIFCDEFCRLLFFSWGRVFIKSKSSRFSLASLLCLAYTSAVELNELFSRQQYSEALKILDEQVNENPRDVIALCNRAICFDNLSMLRRCLKDLDTALALDPRCLRAYHLKGLVLRGKARESEAVAVWRAALEVNGDFIVRRQIEACLLHSAHGTRSPEQLPLEEVATGRPQIRVEVPVAATEHAEHTASDANTAQANASAAGAASAALQSAAASASAAAAAEAASVGLTVPTSSVSVIGTPVRGSAAAAAPVSVSSEAGLVVKSKGGVILPHIPNNVSFTHDPKFNPIIQEMAQEFAGRTLTTDEAIRAAAERGIVHYGTQNVEVDQRIAVGYLFVNTGNYPAAISFFTQMLKDNPAILAAYLGRGSAYALSGDFDSGIRDFTSAIQRDPKCADAWKRRGQTRAAKGCDSEAITDFNMSIKLNANDPDALHGRGLSYFKLKNSRRAAADFRAATQLDPKNKSAFNHLGLCLTALGATREGLVAHLRACEVDNLFKEAWANIGQAYRELGDGVNALKYLQRPLDLDPNYTQCLYMRALVRMQIGDHLAALADCSRALEIDISHKDARHTRGVVQQALGLFRDAVSDYNIIINSVPYHHSYYQREIAIYTQNHLDVPINSFNLDRDLDPLFKEYYCKRLPQSSLTSALAAAQRKMNRVTLNKKIRDVESNPRVLDEALVSLIEMSKPYGKSIQYRAAGFLENRRQHRMAGLAIFDAAYQLRQVWAGNKSVNDARASVDSAPHEFGWRDLFDIVARWRQFSEPNDPVWWVDQLSKEAFAEGFGSHTPMVTGQTEVVRYFCFSRRSVAIMKELMKEQYPHIDQDAIRGAETCQELWELVKHDFFVVTPCKSLAVPGRLLEGTRLTVQTAPPEGWEFSIRTPGTPDRWKQFDQELKHAFDELCKAATKPERDIDECTTWCLTLVYYWYVFMPLTRGSAACGIIMINAILLALGYRIGRPIPNGLQPDWEAILRPSPEEYVAMLRDWIFPYREAVDTPLPATPQIFTSLRRMLEALNFDGAQ
jgi:tetratricopeptide (TPR) repeat protein